MMRIDGKGSPALRLEAPVKLLQAGANALLRGADLGPPMGQGLTIASRERPGVLLQDRDGGLDVDELARRQRPRPVCREARPQLPRGLAGAVGGAARAQDVAPQRLDQFIA